MEFLSLAFLLGVWSEENLLYSSVTALCSGFLALCLTLFLKTKKKEETEWRLFGGTALFLLFLCAGVIRGQFILEKEFTKKEQKPFLISIKHRDIDEKSAVYEGETDGGERILIRTDVIHKREIGDVLRVSPPWKEDLFLLSKDKKSLLQKGEYLQRKGVYHELLFPHLEKEVSSSSNNLSFVEKLTQFRESSAEETKKHLPLREADLANGIIFGDRYLTVNEKQLFQDAGISHIVALSGFNISIIIASLLIFVRFVPFLLRTLVVGCFVALYIIMVDMSGSLLRASFMAFLSGFIFFFGSRGDEKKILFASLFLLTLLFPQTVLSDSSLHLSYGALFGVLYVFPPLFGNIALSYAGYKKVLLVVLCESVSVSLVIIPYTMYAFHSLSLFGVIASTLVTPLVPLATVLSLLLFLSTYLFSSLAALVAIPLFVICFLIYVVADSFSKLPPLSFFASFSAIGLMFYYGALIFTIFILKHKNNQRENASFFTKKEEELRVITGVIHY